MSNKEVYLKVLRNKQRRFLRKRGWKAVPALKTNGAFLWRWIRAGYKKAYSRKEAVQITQRRNLQ